MKQPDLVHIVLLNAWEESELYHIIWELNSVCPDWSTAKKLSAARATVGELLSRGWIVLHRYKYPNYDWVAVDPADHRAILAEPLSWEPPASDRWTYLIDVTDEGRKQF